MRTQSRHLTGPTPATLPAVDTIDGRAVAWRAWVPARRAVPACGHCRHNGPMWITWGQVDPADGDEIVDPATGRPSRAWPTLRLVAHHCPTCHHHRVYDTKGGRHVLVGASRDAEQLSLFADIPVQRRVR